MNVGFHPSKVVITKLKLDKDRKAILEKLDRSKKAAAKDKEKKISEAQVSEMQKVD